MTRARLRFPQGDPLELDLDEVVGFGPPVAGFRAWLGAVNASSQGRWIVRLEGDEVMGFRREELKRVRLVPDGAELTLRGGGEDRTVSLREADVRSWSPEPDDVRSWLGRLAHGSGDAWVRLRDGRELHFPIGNGPHVQFRDPAAPHN